jgi:hypothetical protein
MTQPLDMPPRAINTGDVTNQRPPTRKRRHWGIIAFLVLIVLPATLFALYAWSTISFVYARGERAGFVQKFSKKGWVCQTWEGEMALNSLPGTIPQLFQFTVRNDSVAQMISKNIGKRLALTYEQHRGIPTNCFGDTEYFVVGARPDQP